MKHLFKIGFIAFALMSLTSCYRVSPDADEESVLIYKPFFFGHGGVDEVAVTTGSTWVSATTDHQEFKNTPLTVTESFKDMMPKDNTPVSFDAYLKVQIQQGKSPQLYQKFGTAWYQHNLQATFRSMVRDKSSIFTMFQLSSQRDISTRLEQEIYRDIATYAKKIGLPVTIMQVSIGSIKPPEEVLKETRNTAAQNQSKLTQTARADAELARKQAEINKAIADRAYLTQMGMSTQEYLQLRALEIEKEKVEIIKDHDNVSVIFGNASPVLPLKH